MSSGFASNLNLAVSFGFQRALSQAKTLDFLEYCLPRKTSSVIASSSTSQVLRDSCSKHARVKMVTSSSFALAGDLVSDGLVVSCGSISSSVKPSSVYYYNNNGWGYRHCRKARLSLVAGDTESRLGARGRSVFNFDRRLRGHLPNFSPSWIEYHTFALSCYSDGVVPDVSTDEFTSAGKLSGIAFSSEPKTLNYNALKLISGACYLPHPAKEETGGEDAHFICVDEQAIGVADGVGGWADVGINAGLYARELMSNSVEAIQEAPEGCIDPLLVLEKAHAKTKALGSSTACIITLKNQGLHAINLGDSGFMVIRNGSAIFESPVQQHGFNFTYQLENGSRGDIPSSGQVFEIPAVSGDIVIAGSDGLFDNVYGNEIAAAVADAVGEGLSPDATAQKIAWLARVRALDRKRQSPFATAAQEAGYTYYGGKLDDITVVVSFISS